jgi:hypothetical protein
VPHLRPNEGGAVTDRDPRDPGEAAAERPDPGPGDAAPDDAGVDAHSLGDAAPGDAAPGDAGLDDDSLMARLTDMFAELDPPPAIIAEYAKQGFGLRTIDAELAALIADSDAMATAVRRAGPERLRLLTFEADGLSVELEARTSGAHQRLLGQLLPPGPARIEVRQGGTTEVLRVDADGQGRFVVDAVVPGPLSLTCHRPDRRPVSTEWTSLD